MSSWMNQENGPYCPRGCGRTWDQGGEYLCWRCSTSWYPSCVVPDCPGEPVKLLADQVVGYCQEHAPKGSYRPKRPPQRKPHYPLGPRVRFVVLERDGFRCRYCGRTSVEVKLHVDHVKSRKDGGTDDLANLVTACEDCNHGKGARSLPPEASQ